MQKEFRDVSISLLCQYKNNTRTHPESQVQRIAESIQKFGFVNPILIDEDFEILAGHGRFAAAKSLHLEFVPCVVVSGLTESQKKAYRIADNKLATESEWDFGALALEISPLEEFSDWFNFGDVSSFMEEQEKEIKEPQIDIIEDDSDLEINETIGSFIKLGDKIELDNHILVCRDSTDQDSYNFFYKEISLVLTDPPYGVSLHDRNSGPNKKPFSNTEKIESDDLRGEDLESFLNAYLKHSVHYLKNGGAFYSFSPQGQGNLLFQNTFNKHIPIRQNLIWVKSNFSMGRQDYHYQHEPIIYGVKPGAQHYFIDSRAEKSIFNYSTTLGKARPDHPSPKPIALFAELIRNSSRPGEIVLDPFLGSGTTLLAADQLGRTCYGIELSPKYCELIIERFKNQRKELYKPYSIKVNDEPLED